MTKKNSILFVLISMKMSESLIGAELVCRNTWQLAGTSGQTLATRGEDNCKLSDWTINWHKNEKFSPLATGLDCCLRNSTCRL